MEEQTILETLASDSDVQIEEFSRSPYNLLVSHKQDDDLPSGIEMLATRNSLIADVVSDYGDNEIENYSRVRIYENE